MSAVVPIESGGLPVVQTDNAAIMAVIARAASDPQTDVDKLERLMAMYERMESKKAETAFNEAMSECQRAIGRVATDRTNSQTRSDYATYAALDRVVRPVYTDNGFSLSFDTGRDAPPDMVRVLCYVAHRLGYTRTYQVDMPADGKGAKGGDVMTKTHAAGSAMQYGMRYLLKLIFNIAIGKDDDGNGASEAKPRITEKQAADLEALIQDVGADRKRFMEFLRLKYKADSIENLAACVYSEVVQAVEAKRK